MHSYLNRIYLPAFLLLAVAGFAQAQKNIVISDSLAAHAEELKVKMGTQMVGKTRKILCSYFWLKLDIPRVFVHLVEKLLNELPPKARIDRQIASARSTSTD